MKRDEHEFNPAIIVMAKVPRAGMVKTRLRPFLSDAQCAELAVCFLKDTVAKAAQITSNIIVAFSPAEDRKEIAALLPLDIILIEQKGLNLGEKLASAIRGSENRGFNPVITIGTDSPTLPLNILRSAVESFHNSKTDLVLGASSDGGYYLIGMRKLIDELFENIAWSSESVYRETVENARRSGIKNLRELPVWYDVDYPAELIRLQNEVAADEGLREIIPETFQWLISQESLFKA